jgi:hypothetical protein
MTNMSILVAIDAANASSSTCYCGQYLDLEAHDGAIWLECPALTAPTRLPAAVSSFLRGYVHDRTFVAELPAVPVVDAEPARAVLPVARRRAAAPA